MRKISKILAILLSVVMSVGVMTACSNEGAGGKNVKGKKEIQVSYWMSGLGEEWINNLVKAFEEENPE